MLAAAEGGKWVEWRGGAEEERVVGKSVVLVAALEKSHSVPKDAGGGCRKKEGMREGGCEGGREGGREKRV